MTKQTRLTKNTVQLIELATHIEFVTIQYESGKQKTIVRIFINEDASISAMTGNGLWKPDDIAKATRSIRRHNKTCLILDKRDQIININ